MFSLGGKTRPGKWKTYRKMRERKREWNKRKKRESEMIRAHPSNRFEIEEASFESEFMSLGDFA